MDRYRVMEAENGVHTESTHSFRCPKCSVTANDLRSKTQGRGTYIMEPSHYIRGSEVHSEKASVKRARTNKFILKEHKSLFFDEYNLINILRYEIHIHYKEENSYGKSKIRKNQTPR